MVSNDGVLTPEASHDLGGVIALPAHWHPAAGLRDDCGDDSVRSKDPYLPSAIKILGVAG